MNVRPLCMPLVLALLAGSPLPLTAVPLDITEIGDFSGAAPLGTLDVGVNIVRGRVGPAPDLSDGFGMVLLDGYTIVHFDFAITESRGGASHGLFDTPVWPPSILTGGGVFRVSLPVRYATPGVLHHFITPPTLLDMQTGLVPGFVAYEVCYDVTAEAPVAEPAVLALVGSAMLGVGLLRRRRRH